MTEKGGFFCGDFSHFHKSSKKSQYLINIINFVAEAKGVALNVHHCDTYHRTCESGSAPRLLRPPPAPPR